jgi:hypothetical protein
MRSAKALAFAFQRKPPGDKVIMRSTKALAFAFQESYFRRR